MRTRCVLPELPEVEVMVRNLRRWTSGRSIREIVVEDPSVVRMGSQHIEALAGVAIKGAWRRAKYAVLDLGEWSLIFHFRMTGAVVHGRPGQRVRLCLELDQGPPISFRDPRRLGEIWLQQSASVDRFFEDRRLGMEPYPVVRDALWWRERLQGLKSAIKPALLRQDRVVGLGNIAGSEICWRIGLDPQTPVPELCEAHWEQLAAAVPRFLAETIAGEDGDEIHYVTSGGANPFAVYGRAGQPCPNCDGAIVRIVQSGRGTFLCPACQPSPPSSV